ncbi:MAG: GNAT family N-acetyltransferase [Legionella sp.]|nr:GNAT family N-acetyltransferase [Legionella sp.]
MQKIKEALVWITDILIKNQIPFQITGGLATHAYGATRPIADIDIDIPEDSFAIFQKEVSKFITYGLAHYKSESWDLMLMTLDYHGQIIDLSGAYKTKIFNAKTNQWQGITEDLSKACIKSIFEINLPVIPLNSLKTYKMALSRAVDVQDIQEINQAKLLPTTIADYPTIQNMAQFYVYDASRECGFCISDNGLYEPNDYKAYFEEPIKKAFLIKVAGEIAGFVLLNEKGIGVKTNWKIDQFFILAKFQGKGIGQQVAHQIFDTHPGHLEISVIPENNAALLFWRKVIGRYTNGVYACESKAVSFDEHQPQRMVLTFNTHDK